MQTAFFKATAPGPAMALAVCAASLVTWMPPAKASEQQVLVTVQMSNLARAAHGSYRLADGRSLNVAGPAQRLRVVIDAGPELTLVPAPLVPEVWVSADGRAHLSFDVRANGLVTGLYWTEQATVASR